jgi:ubiquinone biosynthesis protein COQ4
MTLHISPHSHWIFLLVLFIDLGGFWNGLLNISDQAVIILMTSVLLSESHMFCLFHPQEILMDRPRVISTSVGHAWDMPANTFGAAYARFMGSRNFSPDDRPPVRFLESEELAYVATRAREVHDFWHVLFNCPTSVVGELALKMVEFQQTLLPMCFLSVVGAPWRLKPEQRSVLFGHYGPWALKAGQSATDLICIYYEKHLGEDLDGLRQKWGIIPAPPRPKKTVS